MKTRVLAEPGSTAEGRLDLFRRLIDVAAEAGATAFKNQWTSSPARMCERRRAASYRLSYERIAYPQPWHEDLSRWCREAGLEYGCAVYLPEDVAAVAHHCAFLKVASFEAQDHALRKAMQQTGLPVVVSTGMMDLNKPSKTAADFDLTDALARSDALLHCVSAYPCPPEAANLSAIGTLGRRFEFAEIGYSDHTKNVLTGALAVAAGAKILEVHFRLNDSDPQNPDYATALSPGELAQYIDLVRQAEVLLGDGVKKPQPAEAAMMPYRVFR